MSIKAKCIIQLRTHDLRHGTARDLAHLNQSRIRGHASMTVASAIGHKMSAFMRDVIDKYVGNTAFVVPPLRPGELEDYYKEKESTLSIRATLLSSTSLARTFDDSDIDIHDNESVPLVVEDQDNAVRLLDVILKKTDLVDLASDEDKDLTLLDALEAAA
ncbi:hypothetical protein G7Y89_g9921 [Cudoniella acicularis]|uniref:Uncharacterized protein n=1 Tax=Cudoniella acicularis TaxID=354080 RepID=A0A8H4RG13_9HELO|nr:hypothetical protein G7Y89_g9921 [Cudoniella acicularis]